MQNVDCYLSDSNIKQNAGNLLDGLLVMPSYLNAYLTASQHNHLKKRKKKTYFGVSLIQS